MKRINLLKLIRFIKGKDLINKYNSVYKDDEEFQLDELLSLTDDEIELIVNSKNDTEALFRLRAYIVYRYNELINLEVSCDSEIVLYIIEDIFSKLDDEEYDKEHKLIKGVFAQTSIESLERIDTFFSTIRTISSCRLDLEMLMSSLGYSILSNSDEGAELILSLANNERLREKLGIDATTEYYIALLNVISKAKYDYQVEQIKFLIHQKKETGEMAFLDEFESEEDKISVLDMFTETTNESHGEHLITLLNKEQDLIKSNPRLLLDKLSICQGLEDEEEIVPISSIKSIDELEYALMHIQTNIEVDENTKVRIKKKNHK